VELLILYYGLAESNYSTFWEHSRFHLHEQHVVVLLLSFPQVSFSLFKRINSYLTESHNHMNGLGWKGPQWTSSFIPPAMCRVTYHRTRLPEPHPAWPWMPPGMGHPQPPWATCSSASPPSVWKHFLLISLNYPRNLSWATGSLGLGENAVQVPLAKAELWLLDLYSAQRLVILISCFAKAALWWVMTESVVDDG